MAKDRPNLRAINSCVHVLALTLWAAATFGSAMAAAVVFPVLKTLGPRLPEYPGFEDQHYLIAGGSVAQKAFLIADLVQFPAAIVVVITLALGSTLFGETLRRPAGVLRMLAIGVAIDALASLLLIVTPQLLSATQAHWSAMKAGDAVNAARHKAAAADIHPVASRLMGVMGASVLVALVSAIWCLARPQSQTGSTRVSAYEEPRLARGGRL